MVVVSRADKGHDLDAVLLGRGGETLGGNVRAEVDDLYIRPPSASMPTRFLPMSWRSPLTVADEDQGPWARLFP